jgi:ribosomal protein S18 acetylase RimI-like enzyme
MPNKASKKEIHISMFIFQPNNEHLVYSKQLLHTDELPYFSCGTHQTRLIIKNKTIVIGICYETLQREHFLKAKQKDVDIYIASVAKSREGIEKANNYFPKIADEFKIPILMANSVGHCDNFLSVGQSAIWTNKGELLKQLDHEHEGLLIYDTECDTAELFQPQIAKGLMTEAEALFQIYCNGKQALEENGIYQWTNNYPTLEILKNDLKKGVLFTLKNDHKIIGAINLSEQQEPEYEFVDWQFDSTKVLVVHRLVIEPMYQKQGFGQYLMDFAEHFATNNNYTSIRLDVYSQNNRAVEFYKQRGYYSRGDISFPERAYSFYGMEKEMK